MPKSKGKWAYNRFSPSPRSKGHPTLESSPTIIVYFNFQVLVGELRYSLPTPRGWHRGKGPHRLPSESHMSQTLEPASPCVDMSTSSTQSGCCENLSSVTLPAAAFPCCLCPPECDSQQRQAFTSMTTVYPSGEKEKVRNPPFSWQKHESEWQPWGGRGKSIRKWCQDHLYLLRDRQIFIICNLEHVPKGIWVSR